MSDNEQQQTEAPKEGFIALHSDYYFTCSSGLAPAKICPTQNNACTKEKYSYLIHHDTATQNIGDFFCRWTVVLAAAVAAAGIVTGGAALVALAAVAVVASGTMCGGLMAPMRKWVGYSQLNTYGGETITLSNKPKHDLALGIGVLCGGPFIGLVMASKTTGILDTAIDKIFPPQVVGGGHSLTSQCQMVCPIGGTITYAPGITGFWSAALYTARNTCWAVLEGFFVGKFVSSGGALFTGGGKILTGQFLKNFVFLQASARGAGIADQVFFEGMLRNGKDFSETGEEAMAGATMFEQPFINIWNRSNEGYYDGSYAKDAEGNYLPEADNGHGTGALLTDTYYAGLSLMGLKAMVDASRQNVNIPKETVEAIRKTVSDAIAKGKSFLFERNTTKVYRTQGGELPNASQHRIYIDENGNIKINGDGMLYVTLDDLNHQIYFYKKRGGAAKGAEIISFEIPESLSKEIQNRAVPQSEGKSHPNSPQISDPTKSSGAYGLPKEYIQKLREQGLKGSGRISQPNTNKIHSIPPVIEPTKNQETK